MSYYTVRETLEKHNQLHLLKYYDELPLEDKEVLLKEIESIDFSILKGKQADIGAGEITPIEAMTIREIEDNKNYFKELGLEALRKNKVAAVLLAGGQGTRLGIDGPKGTLNIGETKDMFIFQCLINNLLCVKRQAAVWIPLVIMTSTINDKATRVFFEEHNYFGYNPDFIDFFVQDMAPSTDFEGKIYLEEKGHISISPNGNGGWFKSLLNSGLLDQLKALGVEWLNVFSVDNVLQKMADPVFIGATLASGSQIGSKVIRKSSPEEKVGVMCRRDGRPSIVEYYDLSPEMAYATDVYGNRLYDFGVILNYLFSVSALEKTIGQNMPMHIVEKKIPCLDEEGNKVNPSEPNGHKYETLVLDMIQMMDSCLVFEIERSKEFAPIKNMHGVDSLDTARIMMKNEGYII